MKTDRVEEHVGEAADEIELMDIINVLWSRKKLILLGTLACMMGAALWSSRLPNVYRVTAVFKPGQTGQIINHSREYVDDTEAIANRIKSGIYDPQVIQEVSSTEPIEQLPWRVKTNKDNHQISVSLEHHDSALAQAALNALMGAVADTYGLQVSVYSNLLQTGLERKEVQIEGLDSKKAYLEDAITKQRKSLQLNLRKLDNQLAMKSRAVEEQERAITAKQRELVTKLERIETLKKKRKITEEKKGSVLAHLEQIENNMQFLLEGRNSLVQKSPLEQDEFKLLLFSDLGQKSIEYANNLRKSTKDIDLEVEDLALQIRIQEAAMADIEQVQIENIKGEIANIRSAMQGLKRDQEDRKNAFDKWLAKTEQDVTELDEKKRMLQLGMAEVTEKIKLVSPLTVLSRPVRTLKPIGPRTGLNVSLATLAGFLLSIFLAFFLEYLAEMRMRRGEDTAVMIEHPSRPPSLTDLSDEEPHSAGVSG